MAGCGCVTVISAGAYCPPCGYSTNEPAPPTPALPGFNGQCVIPPPVPRPWSRWITYDDIVINREKQEQYATCKTFVIENNIHHQHNKTVITNVNRNHWHTQRVVVKDNHFHHHLTNNVVKVNDIHHQKIEQVKGEGKTFNDFKQTQRIEGAQCINDQAPAVANPCAQPCQPCPEQNYVY